MITVLAFYTPLILTSHFSSYSYILRHIPICGYMKPFFGE